MELATARALSGLVVLGLSNTGSMVEGLQE